MNFSMPIKDVYVANPVFPYTYFPISDVKDHVDAMRIETGKFKDPRAANMDCMLAHFQGQYIGEMTHQELDAMLAEVKTELKLDHLEWSRFIGRCLITIGVKDLPHIYKIVKAFSSRGRRVYMQDTTQTEFPAFCEPSYELQQQLILESLTAALKAGFGDPFDLFHAPAHRSKFWSIPAGQELAKKLRELTHRKDERSNFVGEFFAEGARKPPADKPAAATAPDKKDEPDAAPMDCQAAAEAVAADKKDRYVAKPDLYSRLRQVMPASVTWQGRQISVDDWDFDRSGTHYGTMGINVEPNTASISKALVAGLDSLPELNSVFMPKSMITICRLAGEYLEGSHARGILVFLGYVPSDQKDKPAAAAADKKDASMDVDSGQGALAEEVPPSMQGLESPPCCICLKNPVETLVLPCMHAVICRSCSNKLKLDKNNMHKCVSCGQPITQVVD